MAGYYACDAFIIHNRDYFDIDTKYSVKSESQFWREKEPN